jgi:hypothetical protein
VPEGALLENCRLSTAMSASVSVSAVVERANGAQCALKSALLHTSLSVDTCAGPRAAARPPRFDPSATSV